jgi:hypothetical protein
MRPGVACLACRERVEDVSRWIHARAETGGSAAVMMPARVFGAGVTHSVTARAENARSRAQAIRV